MPVNNEKDPFRAYNFKLIISENSDARFMKCSGMEVKVNTYSYRESGNNQVVRKIPGKVDYAPVVLEYGLCSSTELWDWFMESVKGNVQRKNVTIQLLDANGTDVVMMWDLINAWPSEWKGSELDTMTNSIAIETLVLSYETLDKKPGQVN